MENKSNWHEIYGIRYSKYKNSDYQSDLEKSRSGDNWFVAKLIFSQILVKQYYETLAPVGQATYATRQVCKSYERIRVLAECDVQKYIDAESKTMK